MDSDDYILRLNRTLIAYLSFSVTSFVSDCFKGLMMVDSSHPSFSNDDASSQCVIVWTSTSTQPLVLKGTLDRTHSTGGVTRLDFGTELEGSMMSCCLIWM